MSGIVGIWNRDGGPVDTAVLGRLTAFMDFRGPDASRTWTGGQVGFGHTMLRTTWEAERETQPCSLDGSVWIVADVRIDARAELLRALAGKGRECGTEATDPELILHAYHAWGEDCVHHLLGDFAFAIWDGRRRQLFCARDHFGVKPFYYAEVAGSLVLSNTLHCLRQHPAVSSDLDDLAIADFLYYGLNQDLSTTSFAAIRRLPPAHTLTASEDGLRISRYWTLPVDGPIHCRNEDDYAEQFLSLLRIAVGDRLRTNRLGIYLSGGLDSSGLAAMARALFDERGGDSDLRAYTVVYDRLIPDEERYYTGLVASALRIPVNFTAADDWVPFAKAGEPNLAGPEPSAMPSMGLHAEIMGRAASQSRVMFYGEGPDNALRHDWSAHIKTRWRAGQHGALFQDVVRYILLNRRVPFMSSLPGRIWSRISPSLDITSHAARRMPPGLLAQSVEAGTWEHRMPGGMLSHPVRPQGYRSMHNPHWQRLFESCDSGATFLPVEWAHPYMDTRMIGFLLNVPAVACSCNKRILRQAFRRILPEQVRRRPKTPLAVDPIWAWTRGGAKLEFQAHPELGRFVAAESRLRVAGVTEAELSFQVRVIGLNFFLANACALRRTKHGGTSLGQIGSE